jgi:hypothetical protein
MQFHVETLADSLSGVAGRLPGLDASGKISGFPRRCFILILRAMILRTPGTQRDG